MDEDYWLEQRYDAELNHFEEMAMDEESPFADGPEPRGCAEFDFPEGFTDANEGSPF